jgi:hypothetical protein
LGVILKNDWSASSSDSPESSVDSSPDFNSHVRHFPTHHLSTIRPDSSTPTRQVAAISRAKSRPKNIKLGTNPRHIQAMAAMSGAYSGVYRLGNAMGYDSVYTRESEPMYWQNTLMMVRPRQRVQASLTAHVNADARIDLVIGYGPSSANVSSYTGEMITLVFI